MIKLKVVFIAGLMAVSGLNCVAQWRDSKLPFDMPKVKTPVFKTDTFSIEKFGAIGDGITKNTKAIANAIKTCSNAGGGVVLIPEGLWLTGPIELKNNVNLHLKIGAMVLFSSDFNDYPMVFSYWEGQEAWRCQSPISGVNLQNIAISGKGIFDGSGDAWRFVKKAKLTANQWKALVASGGVLSADKNTWYPSESSLLGNQLYYEGKMPPVADTASYKAIKDYQRPVMVSIVSCKTVLLDGPTFQNSPSWCIHPLLCEDLTVRNITVRNPWYSQNGDGIDVESCKNGIINNCTFDVGDDAMCIKSGKNAEGRKRGKATENFIITDCVVFHGHGGFVVGSEMSGGVRNMFVSNCTFLGTDIGLRFKSQRGRGGIVENIYIQNISMVNIPAEAIRFDMYYQGTSPIPEGDEKVVVIEADKIYPVNEETPQFKNFFIRNVNCNGAAQAIHLQGLPEMKIRNINIENSKFKTDKGITCIDGENITMSNLSIDLSKGDGALIVNSSAVVIDNFKASNYNGKLIKITGENSSNITLSGKDAKILPPDVQIGAEVKGKVIIK